MEALEEALREGARMACMLASGGSFVFAAICGMFLVQAVFSRPDGTEGSTGREREEAITIFGGLLVASLAIGAFFWWLGGLR